MRFLRPYPASPEIERKLEEKHQIAFAEVEELFHNRPRIIRGKKDQYGEYRYTAFGQTDDSRYLMAVFIGTPPDGAKVITARDMNEHERRRSRRGKSDG